LNVTEKFHNMPKKPFLVKNRKSKAK